MLILYLYGLTDLGIMNTILLPLISTLRRAPIQQWPTRYTSCYMKLVNQFLQQTNLTPKLQSNVFTAVKSLGINKCRRGVRAGRIVQERRTRNITPRQITVQINNERRSTLYKFLRFHVPGNCVNISTDRILKISTIPSILLSNVCHLTNKVDELRCVADVNNPSIVIITESWLSSDIPTTAIKLKDSHNTHRKDRTNRQGGGVVAYIQNDLHSKRLLHLEDDEKEVLWLKLLPKRLPRPFSCMAVAGIYFPPGNTVAEGRDMIDYLTQCLDTLLRENPSAGILLAGDFNQLDLKNLCRNFSLRKLVLGPTRGKNTLDQIITNMANLYNPAIHLPPLGKSDHQCLLAKPKIQIKMKTFLRKVRTMHPNNIAMLTIRLNNHNWDEVLSAQGIDQKVEKFTQELTTILNQTMPMKTIRMHPSDKPWLTPHIKDVIAQRQRAYSKGDMMKYKQLQEKAALLISKAKLNHYQSKTATTRTRNPAKWFKSIYSLCGASEPSENPSNISAENLYTIVEKFQDVFTKPWNDYIPMISSVDSESLPEVTPVLPSIGQVKMILKTLNPRKATGADNISAWTLKNYAEELAVVIHNIICGSITECKYPNLYKHALVSPVPKVNPPRDIETDFRQISVLPVLGKVLEKVQVFLNKDAFKVKENQHAFSNNRSTVSALINVTQTWFNNTDNTPEGRKAIHCLFIDFSKAFDMVDHSILLSKLKARNINKHLWLWIQSFLENRSQQVKIPDALSSTKPCPAGVPQGSVISPLLFNIFIDDFDDAIPEELRDQATMCKYADDCTVFECIPKGSPSDLQRVLDNLQNWSTENNMLLNSKKTKDMWISFHKTSNEPDPLIINDSCLERVAKFKLLGVWHQNNLCWNYHIEQTVKKANKRLYYLREVRKAGLPTKVGLTIYCTKIRPLLEYASPVWGGIPKYLSDDLQKLQNRCLDIIGVERTTLPALKERREDSTKREIERTINTSNHPNQIFINTHVDRMYNLRSNQRNKSAVRITRSGTQRHMNSFLSRATRLLT